MKTYSDYQKEITASQLYKGLLVHGMFCEKLPPVFTMDFFWEYIQSLKQPFSGKDHDFVYFESMRNTGIPRPLGLPVPMAYQRLCKGLKDNWSNIQEHFIKYTSQQSHKISRIHLRKIKDSERIFEMNYKKWWVDPEPTENLLIGKRYLVKADISTFFPSIYTHSIPWALVGKEVSKANRKETLWFNRIDKLCRTNKSGETHGLLIGPHCSNLISEIILTVIDFHLYKEGYSFIRNIDDYECYVESYEKGETFVSSLSAKLREYDLNLNRKKTQILPLPIASAEKWVNRLNDALAVHLGKKVERKHIKAVMDTIVTLIDETGDTAILKYAMKVLADPKIEYEEAAKDYYIKTVLHLAVIYPYAVQVIDQYVFDVFKPDTETISHFTNIVFNDAEARGNYEAIYYALFFSLKYGFKIKDIDVNNVVESNDCLYKLFAWMYFEREHDTEAINLLKRNAIDLKKHSSGTMDRYWIFCYEILSDGQLNDEWKAMKKNGVSFIRKEIQQLWCKDI